MPKLVIFSVQRSSHKSIRRHSHWWRRTQTSGKFHPLCLGWSLRRSQRNWGTRWRLWGPPSAHLSRFLHQTPQPPSQPSPQIGLEEGEEPRKDAQIRESHSRRMHGKSDLCTYAISKTVIINWKCTLLNQIACISRYAAGTQVGTPSGKLFGAYGY